MKRFNVKIGERIYNYEGEAYNIDGDGLNIIIYDSEGLDEYVATFKDWSFIMTMKR